MKPDRKCNIVFKFVSHLSVWNCGWVLYAYASVHMYIPLCRFKHNGKINPLYFSVIFGTLFSFFFFSLFRIQLYVVCLIHYLNIICYACRNMDYFCVDLHLWIRMVTMVMVSFLFTFGYCFFLRHRIEFKQAYYTHRRILYSEFWAKIIWFVSKRTSAQWILSNNSRKLKYVWYRSQKHKIW